MPEMAYSYHNFFCESDLKTRQIAVASDEQFMMLSATTIRCLWICPEELRHPNMQCNSSTSRDESQSQWTDSVMSPTNIYLKFANISHQKPRVIPHWVKLQQQNHWVNWTEQMWVLLLLNVTFHVHKLHKTALKEKSRGSYYFHMSYISLYPL